MPNVHFRTGAAPPPSRHRRLQQTRLPSQYCDLVLTSPPGAKASDVPPLSKKAANEQCLNVVGGRRRPGSTSPRRGVGLRPSGCIERRRMMVKKHCHEDSEPTKSQLDRPVEHHGTSGSTEPLSKRPPAYLSCITPAQRSASHISPTMSPTPNSARPTTSPAIGSSQPIPAYTRSRMGSLSASRHSRKTERLPEKLFSLTTI